MRWVSDSCTAMRRRRQRHIHGAYFYRVPPGQEHRWDGKKQFRLGATLPEAYRVWADRMEAPDNARTIGELLDRYALEVVPEKAPKSRVENARYIATLRAVFAAMPLRDLIPKHVYTYVDKRRDAREGKDRRARTAAHREIELLSHAFSKAVEWGYINKHPFKGEVQLRGEKPRTRYVEDWEVVECLALAPVRRRESILAIHAYMRMKLLTGLRRSDLLRLRVADCKEDGIHVVTHKTSKPVVPTTP